jgi:hypothetical protein
MLSPETLHPLWFAGSIVPPLPSSVGFFFVSFVGRGGCSVQDSSFP